MADFESPLANSVGLRASVEQHRVESLLANRKLDRYISLPP